MAVKTFILHDETVNTYGIRMLTAGANLDEFRRNPVMLLNHNDWELPIGRWENIRIEGTRILADAVFDETDSRAKEVAGKVERDFLRMASISAWVDEASEDPAYRMPGQTGPTIVRWTAREASICPIGANHNALALYDRATGTRVDLNDRAQVIRLFAGSPNTAISNDTYMTLKELLKLNDAAGEAAVTEAVEAIIRNRDELQTETVRLRDENKQLTERLESINKAKKEAEQTEAVRLVDGAIREARINADGREAWLKDFEMDFAQASVRLASIPKRPSIAAQVTPAGTAANMVQLADMSFADILKADRLKELKKDHELYVQKFREAYGHDPS